MKIEYDEKEDILMLSFSDEAVIQDVSYGWNVNIGMTRHGIGQITILDAKTDGLLPLQVPFQILKEQVIAK